MYFDYLREYILGILIILPKTDDMSDDTPDDIDHVIKKIRKLEPNEKLNIMTAETLAIAEMLALLGNSLPNVYKRLPKINQLQLQSIYSDDIAEEKNATGRKWDYFATPYNLDISKIIRYTKRLKAILEKFTDIPMIQPPFSVGLIESPRSHALFKKMIDVDMGKDQTMILTDKNQLKFNTKFLGTKGLASCVAILVIGIKSNGEYVVNLGHYCSPTESAFEEQRKRLLKTGAISASLCEFMFGSCISSLPDALELAYKRGKRLIAFNLGMSNLGMQEYTNVVVCLEKGKPFIYYTTETNDPHLQPMYLEREQNVFGI